MAKKTYGRRWRGMCCPVYEDAIEKSTRWWKSLDEDHRLFMTKDWFGRRRINLKPEEYEKIYAVSRWLHLMDKEFCGGDIVAEEIL